MIRQGRPKTLNPIAIYLNEFMARQDLTKEEICVACDIRYPTLDNLWKRRNVSYAVLKALKYGGVISAEIEKKYLLWIKEYGK